MDITPLCIHWRLMNCFNKVIFLRFYNELKFHSLSRDWKMFGLSPGIKISISSKVDIAPLCFQPSINKPMVRQVVPGTANHALHPTAGCCRHLANLMTISCSNCLYILNISWRCAVSGGVSVCLSVCLSHSRIVSKWLKIQPWCYGSESETTPKLSNCTNFHDVEWSLTQISRSWYY